MKLTQALLPLSYFGPISHFAICAQLDSRFEVRETYQKSSTRNKCQILGSNGVLYLSVPLRKGKTLNNIREVEIAYDENWVDLHLKTLRSAYGTSPYFDFYFHHVERLLNSQAKLLFELNKSILNWFSDINIINATSFTERYVKELKPNTVDLRSKKSGVNIVSRSYEQVFSDKFGFVQDLSILDLLFNLGPETPGYLKEIQLDLI